MDSQPDKDRKLLAGYQQAGHYLGLGAQFAVSILLGLWGGWWLDRRVGTSPLFLLVGALLGGVAGFYALYRALMEEQRRDRERRGR